MLGAQPRWRAAVGHPLAAHARRRLLAGARAAAVLLALLPALGANAQQQEQEQHEHGSIMYDEALISSAAGGRAVFAPGVTLDGDPIAVVDAHNANSCAQACRDDARCDWFNWCDAQVSGGA